MGPVKIKLENYAGQYYPGTVIRGSVLCTLKSRTSFQVFHGEAKVSFTTTVHHENSYQRISTYIETEPLLNYEIFLKSATSEDDLIPAGDYEYPFSFKLPNFLPSTFKDTYGYITYKMTALIDRPWGWNYKSELTFKIVNPINRNISAFYKGPFTLTASKNLVVLSYCGFRNLGQLSFTVGVASRGFVAGQRARLHVVVKNFSSVPMKTMSCRLTQEIISKQSGHFGIRGKNEEVICCRSYGCEIDANEERQFVMEMDIPKDLNVPNLDSFSTLFETVHTLEVTAIPKGLHLNLSDSTKVLLRYNPIVDNRVLA